MKNSSKKYINKIYIDTKILKKIKKRCLSERKSLNNLLTLEIKELTQMYQDNNLFF